MKIKMVVLAIILIAVGCKNKKGNNISLTELEEQAKKGLEDLEKIEKGVASPMSEMLVKVEELQKLTPATEEAINQAFANEINGFTKQKDYTKALGVTYENAKKQSFSISVLDYAGDGSVFHTRCEFLPMNRKHIKKNYKGTFSTLPSGKEVFTYKKGSTSFILERYNDQFGFRIFSNELNDEELKNIVIKLNQSFNYNK